MVEEIRMRRNPTKAELICYAILKNGPQARKPLLRTAYELRPTKTRFKPTSNMSYFATSTATNGGAVSLRLKGLIFVVAKEGNTQIFDLTPAGIALATACANTWF
jgi:hypothetical protein